MMEEPITIMKKNPFNKEQRKLAKAILFNTRELDHFEERMSKAEVQIQDLMDDQVKQETEIKKLVKSVKRHTSHFIRSMAFKVIIVGLVLYGYLPAWSLHFFG